MKNTGYDHHDTLIEKRASGYQKTPDGYVNAPYLDMSLPYAAGSMYSTVEDLYLWDQALYTDRVLSAAVQGPDVSNRILSDYAYGWVVTKAKLGTGTDSAVEDYSRRRHQRFQHRHRALPAQKHLIVLLDNTSQGRSLEQLERELTNILYNQPHNLPKMAVAEVLPQDDH